MQPKERIYAVMNGREPDRQPVTPIFMAWCAEYIGRTYRDYYIEPAVLAQAQIAVARDFGFDQVSAISDPFREAEGYGMRFEYPRDDVPRPLGYLINEKDDIKKIKKLNIKECSRMRQRIESIFLMAEEVSRTHSILGWIEGPMAEYADLRGVQNALFDLADTPEMFLECADVLVDNAVAFAKEQVTAGADMIGIGDAAASLLGPDLYEKYVLPSHIRLFKAVQGLGAAVKLHICGNITSILELIARARPDVVDIDSMVDLGTARARLGEEITLCGNINPAETMLRGKPRDVREAAAACIRAAGKRFILMAGCEIPPGTPRDNLRALHLDASQKE